MKTLLTLLVLLLVSISASAEADRISNMHRALCGVNRQWAKLPQEWARPADQPLLTDKDWIQHHLRVVEEHLRSRTPANLTTQQKEARLRSLDVLHRYWQAGHFPQNETHPVRTPVFIDAYGTFCAVGFLLEQSGAGALARSVAAQNNFVYLPDLGSPALDSWAQEHGFTRDELAWIQPGYAPSYFALAVGRGTSGWVNELLVSSDGQKLYVGGEFMYVNGSLLAPNIAYITESASTYTWHALGAGLEGQVSALVEWNGKLVAGGNGVASQGSVGSSLAFWDGTSWSRAGETYGDVFDLAVFRDTLYASGSFNTPTGFANFARWNGAQWIPIPGLTGHVNTMEVVGNHLFLGGRFMYNGDTANAIRWNTEGSFQPFANRVWNEVRDFEIFMDDVFAACRFTSGIVHSPTGLPLTGGTDTNLVNRLVGDTWHSCLRTGLYPMYLTPSRTVSVNTLLADGDTLMSGGNLYIPVQGAGTFVNGVLPIIQPNGADRWFTVDSSINKLVLFKQSVFAGGRMKSMYHKQLNGICRQVYSYQAWHAASVTEGLETPSQSELTLYPNPGKGGTTASLNAAFPVRQIQVFDAAGRIIWSAAVSDQKQLSIPVPQSPGNYIVECVGAEENRASTMLTVE